MFSQSTFLASVDVAAGAGSAARAAPVQAKAADRNARVGRICERFMGSPLVELLACWSPDLHSAVDHDIDACHVRAVFAGQEQRNVRHLLRPTETTEQRLAKHVT